MNRNRILHPDKCWQYITVPIEKGPRDMKIHQAKVVDAQACRDKIIGQLAHYRKKAPFYSEVCSVIDDVFSQFQGTSLVELNTLGIAGICHYLDIPFNFKICSKENWELADKMEPGQWALEISTIVGANEYINPPGGRDIFNMDDFKKRGITLSFLEQSQFSYPCSSYEFVENLSIIDVLMWNDRSAIRNLLIADLL